MEEKIKKITPINDKWVTDRPYGKTYYYTFLDDEYCASMCEQKNGKNTYVVSNKKRVLYMGFSEENAIKKVKELVKKWTGKK